MCFSAPASFGVSTALLPIGAFTLTYAMRHDRRYLALAAFPLLFSAQQGFEGVLWLSITAEGATGLTPSALGFLFFAYLLWPFFVPFAANRVETDPSRQGVFRWFTVIGLLFGLSLYLPLLINPEWLTVSLSRHSILYEPVLIYDGIVSRTVVRVFYAVLVSIPLLFSTVVSLRHFGIMIVISVIFSAVFFVYAFVSVWCFFAAVLSLYVVIVLRKGEKLPARSGRCRDASTTRS